MDQSNSFADGINYGSVQIDADSVLGTVQFTVDAFTPAVYGAIGPNFGIQSFGFNFQNLTSTPAAWGTALPAGWSQNDAGGNEDGFGSFMVTEDGTVYAVQMADSFGDQGFNPESGSVVTVSADGIEPVAEGLNFPYGLAQSPDGGLVLSVNAAFGEPGSGMVIPLAM